MRPVRHFGLRRRDIARGMRTRMQWHSDMRAWFKRKAMFFAALFLASIPLLLLSNVELRMQLVEKQEAVFTWIGKLAHAMNGGVLFEKTTGTAYFFGKPTPVKLEDKK